MGSLAAEREIEREGARVLRHLAKGRLERRRSGDYALAARAGGKARLSVAADLVAAFEARGWIGREPDGRYGLAAGGEAWMRRARAAAPDAFRRQHGAIEDLGAGLAIDRAAAPLDALKRLAGPDGRSFLTPEQAAAADRLAEDFERAHLRPRLTRDPEALPGGAVWVTNTADRLGAGAYDARRRCLAALDAAGPGLGDLLFDVVCVGRGLGEAERGFGWPQRSAKAILRLGLDRLAVHYGLASGRRPPGRIEVWRSALDSAPDAAA